MTSNPWLDRLTDAPPFVLPDEEAVIREFNRKATPSHHLHIDEILPESFVGNPKAPVLLLGNNPGFTEAGLRDKGAELFRQRMRKNLFHMPSDCPFVFLAPGIENRDWWERKLKHLIQRCGLPKVVQSVFAVEYFPYPSRKYCHWPYEP